MHESDSLIPCLNYCLNEQESGTCTVTAPLSFTPSLSVSHPSPSLFHFHSFSVSITLGSLFFFFLTCFSPFSFIYIVVWIHKSKNIWTTTNNLKQTKKDQFLQFITLKCSSVYNLVLAFQYQVHKNILPVPESITVAYCSIYYPPCIQNSITILNNWLVLLHQFSIYSLYTEWPHWYQPYQTIVQCNSNTSCFVE